MFGLLSETLAFWVKPHIELLIALLLTLACLRVGPQLALGAKKDLKASLLFSLGLQLLIPLLLIALFRLLDIDHPLALAIILLTAAPSISGSPHLVTLLGHDPAPALRLLIVGVALLPITIIPVLLLIPDAGGFSDIAIASLRLLVVISLAVGLAFMIRKTWLKNPGKLDFERLDGLSTILLGVVVLGLMSAIHAEIERDISNILITLAVATLVNIGLQILAALVLFRSPARSYTVAVGLIAGNRNIALFLTALAVMSTQPILLFVACYQVPMYLTPMLMGRFYKKLSV